MPRWVFRYAGNKTFDFSSKKRIFCLKTTKFSPKLAFLSITGPFGTLLVVWLVVVARAVSRKTPIYFISIRNLFWDTLYIKYVWCFWRHFITMCQDWNLPLSLRSRQIVWRPHRPGDPLWTRRDWDHGSSLHVYSIFDFEYLYLEGVFLLVRPKNWLSVRWYSKSHKEVLSVRISLRSLSHF